MSSKCKNFKNSKYFEKPAHPMARLRYPSAEAARMRDLHMYSPSSATAVLNENKIKTASLFMSREGIPLGVLSKCQDFAKTLLHALL